MVIATEAQEQNNQEYIREMRAISNDDVDAAIAAIKLGIEYVQMCLEEHKENSDLSIIKNRAWLDRMTVDIRRMEVACKNISK